MTTPAAKQVWLVIDAAGIPMGPPDNDEAGATATAKALDERTPQYGPYRVQKYVVEDRVEFVHEWYANRFERLRVWANTSLTESQRHQYFSIVANGTLPGEPPTYAQLMNVKQHEIERRIAQLQQSEAARDAVIAKLEADLKAAHAALRAMLTGVDRGHMVPVGEVMSALIGAMQTEDGLTMVRYCGHLERLLKQAREDARAHAGENVPKPDEAD